MLGLEGLQVPLLDCERRFPGRLQPGNEEVLGSLELPERTAARVVRRLPAERPHATVEANPAFYFSDVDDRHVRQPPLAKLRRRIGRPLVDDVRIEELRFLVQPMHDHIDPVPTRELRAVHPDERHESDEADTLEFQSIPRSGHRCQPKSLGRRRHSVVPSLRFVLSHARIMASVGRDRHPYGPASELKQSAEAMKKYDVMKGSVLR